jgi:retron-type reverse transcriptase
VPCVVDRVAQTVAVAHLEPLVEKVFHPDSYGYRPGRSPLDAVATAERDAGRTGGYSTWTSRGSSTTSTTIPF